MNRIIVVVSALLVFCGGCWLGDEIGFKRGQDAEQKHSSDMMALNGTLVHQWDSIYFANKYIPPDSLEICKIYLDRFIAAGGKAKDYPSALKQRIFINEMHELAKFLMRGGL